MDDSRMTMETHRKFQKALANSDKARWKVANWLWSKGLTVTLSPTFIAPTPEERNKYKDHGDIIAYREGQEPRRFEVKGLLGEDRVFTSRDDFPWPNCFIVAAKKSFDRAVPVPEAYFIVSSDLKHAGICFVKNSDRWYVRSFRHHYVPDVMVEFYCSPLEDVRFVSLSNGMNTEEFL